MSELSRGSDTMSTVFYDPEISVTLENNLYSYGVLDIYSIVVCVGGEALWKHVSVITS